MATLITMPRSPYLWLNYVDEHGKRRRRATKFTHDQQIEAEVFAAKVEKQLEEVRAKMPASVVSPDPTSPTVAEFVTTYTDYRKAKGRGNDKTVLGHLNNHLVPVLGAKTIRSVTPPDVFAWREGLPKTLAPYTVIHICRTVGHFFKVAVKKGLIEKSPYLLDKDDLPKGEAKDPEKKADAVYTREEVETLISDVRVPQQTRVMVALMALLGLRHSEAARLRWKDYDRSAPTLGRMSLWKTKAKIAREIPVHPTLAAVLAAWKLGGFEFVYGRQPNDDDRIVPSLTGGTRDPSNDLDQLHQAQDDLGMRQRGQHDLRATFSTLAQEAGVNREVLHSLTHGNRGDVLGKHYTRKFSWEAKCAVVSALAFTLRESVPNYENGRLNGRLQSRARKRWCQVPASVLVSATEAHPALVTGTVFKTDGAS